MRRIVFAWAMTASAAAAHLPIVQQPPASAPAGTPRPASTSLPAGTALQLMVVTEVRSDSARIGDRFRLRLNRAVTAADGTVLLPVGTIAWGIVTARSKASGMGAAGHLAFRLVGIDLPDGTSQPIMPAPGVDSRRTGRSMAREAMLAISTVGVIGAFHRGNNGRLKAGELIDAVAMAPGTTGE